MPFIIDRIRILILFSLLCLLVYPGAYAQPSGVAADWQNYPDLTLKFRERNPDPVVHWQIAENDGRWDSSRVSSKPGASFQTTRILVLFENGAWPEFSPQREYFRRSLIKVLKHPAADSVQWHFADFDWTDGKGRAIDPARVFRGKPAQLIARLKRLQPNRRLNHLPQITELNTAIYDGLRYMDSLPADSTAADAILVLSGEVYNVFNTQVAQGDLISESKKRDVAIYAVRYPRLGQKYSLERLCSESYGKYLSAAKKNWSTTASGILEMIRAVAVRAAGLQYEVTYASRLEIGGSSAQVSLRQGVGPVLTTLSVQPPTRLQWIGFKFHRVLIALALILLPIAAVVWWFRRSQSLKQTAAAEERQRTEALRAREEQDAKRKRLAEEARIRRKSLEAQSEARFMNRPRKAVLIGSDGRNWHLSAITSVVGRDPEGQVVIQHPTVSRKHCLIAFEKYGMESEPVPDGFFYIRDLQSANGTFLNGSRIDRIERLADGAQLRLGEHTLTFRD